MKLEKYLKLDELKDFFEKNQIAVRKSNIGIDLVTKNNFSVSIHKQAHVLPGQEPIIYLDCFLGAFGLPELRRDWHENEDLSAYLVKVVIPYIVDLGGPFNISENEACEVIIRKLNDCGIRVDDKKTCDLKYTLFDYQGNEVEGIKSNKPLIIFTVNNTKYAIDYKKAAINLIIFKSLEENEIFLSYPWFSFCSVFLAGKNYIEAVVEGIVSFIKNRSV